MIRQDIKWFLAFMWALFLLLICTTHVSIKDDKSYEEETTLQEQLSWHIQSQEVWMWDVMQSIHALSDNKCK
jgi:hypothetical protein